MGDNEAPREVVKSVIDELEEEPEWTEDDLMWVLAWISYVEEKTKRPLPDESDSSN